MQPELRAGVPETNKWPIDNLFHFYYALPKLQGVCTVVGTQSLPSHVTSQPGPGVLLIFHVVVGCVAYNERSEMNHRPFPSSRSDRAPPKLPINRNCLERQTYLVLYERTNISVRQGSYWCCLLISSVRSIPETTASHPLQPCLCPHRTISAVWPHKILNPIPARIPSIPSS